MRLRSFILGSLLCGTLATALTAQTTTSTDVRRLTLDEAIAASLARNYTVRINALAPRIAATDVRSARGFFDPVFSGTVSRLKNENPLAADRPEASVLEQQGYELALEGQLTWGGRYDISISNFNIRDSFNNFADEYDTSASVTFVQPLLRGAGREANLADIRIAQRGVRIAQEAFRETAINTVTETVTAYHTLRFAREALEVARQSLDLAERLLGDNRRRVETGSMAPVDIVLAETEVALRQETVINAELAVRRAENRLKQLVSDEGADLLAVTLELAPPPPVELFTPQVPQDVRTAIAARPDLRQAELTLQIREAQLVRATRDELPALDLFARYGYNGIGTSTTDSFDNLATGNHESWTVGATFSVNIPNRTRDARRTRALLERNQAALDRARVQHELALALDDAAAQVRASWARIEATRRSRELAGRSLEAEEKRLAAGTTTTFRVLELQEDLANAQVRERRAITDYRVARADYERLMGVTLERHRITLADDS